MSTELGVRWSRLIRALNPNVRDDIVDAWWQRICNAYTESHRHYHILDHLEFCFKEFDEVASCLEKPHLVEIALWFHDVVYRKSVPNGSNEQASADLFRVFAEDVGLREDDIRKVVDLILATTHEVRPDSFDGQVMVDIDMSILGTCETAFRVYEEGIRKENSEYSDKEYAVGRLVWLSRTLKTRSVLYFTTYFYEKYEARARLNMTQLIGSLGKSF